MKSLPLLFVLIPAVVIGQARFQEADERILYFRSHPIFVTQSILDEKSVKKADKDKIKDARVEIETFNRNLRTAFTTFWDISDTVIFVSVTDMKAKMKEFKGGIFFEMVKIGEHKNDRGQTLYILGFKLSRPDKSDYFKNIVPQLGVDSSLVNLVSQVRQLKLAVTTGETINKKRLGPKTILINNDEQRNKAGEDYVNLVRSKYKEKTMEVENKFILDVLMRKDPKYVYIVNATTYNAEDGTLIALY